MGDQFDIEVEGALAPLNSDGQEDGDLSSQIPAPTMDGEPNPSDVPQTPERIVF